MFVLLTEKKREGSSKKSNKKMMMMEDERNNNLSVNDIDISLLRLSSPPYDYSHSSSFFSANEISPPLKRSSPVSDESDLPKRRKLSPQDPIFITSPLLFTSPEIQSSSIQDPIQYPNLTGPVSEKKETSPSASDTETMKMVNNCAEEINREETNYAYEKEQEEVEEEEEDCGGGMRIERSGDGFVIRLKCKCRQAFRVLFSDHHLYFKPL